MTDTNHAEVIREALSYKGPIEEYRDTRNRALTALDALTRELDDQERSHLKTIDQRDAAEDALGDAYALVTGNQPEWSNAFGYANALEDIDATIASQSARLATLEAFIADLDCECTPPERLVDGEMTEKWICLRCAALAPSKGER